MPHAISQTSLRASDKREVMATAEALIGDERLSHTSAGEMLAERFGINGVPRQPSGPS
ncbi:hypothetical protein [Fodinicola acaciae]|uniref:hypothetical protein n=1 Tax=Fodinicola acaciae TaxID=2681555 RepID=UPI0013D2E286|nr:hypothetical protein [Fodinicola acaciae]